FANYAFNKSHAAAYAFLAYQTAFLKRYYKVEFITAVLNNRIARIDEIANYLMYLKENGIEVLLPDINRSEVEFSVEFGELGVRSGECGAIRGQVSGISPCQEEFGGLLRSRYQVSSTVENLKSNSTITSHFPLPTSHSCGSVRVGFAALKNVGAAVVSLIVKERETGGLFKSFEDFVKRMNAALQKDGKNALNKKLLESLIYSGAFDSLGVNRSTLINGYESVLDSVRKDAAAALSGQMSFFDMAFVSAPSALSLKPYPEYSLAEKLKMEKTVAGVYLSGHPLMAFAEKLRELPHTTAVFSPDEEPPSSVTLGGMLQNAAVKYTKAGKEIGTALIEDLVGSAEIMISSDKLARYRGIWQNDRMVTIHGRVNTRDEGAATVWVDKIEAWDTGTVVKKKKMCIYFYGKDAILGSLPEIKELLQEYPGGDEIYVSYNEGEKKVINLLDGVGADVCDMLKNELMGYTCVRDVRISE
ncbi:MAG: hypothetical protein FWE84_01395, partial [Firmicutes bacterium]|nr:hypothetical protein [Bacillota bacterium]